MQTDIIGTTIDGKFRILGILGEGAFGTVYKAEQTELSRIVALKILNRSTLSDGTAKARFEREAAVLATLMHQNIVRIYGFGLADGQHPYLYMEYLQGKLLEQVVSKQRPFSWQKTVSVGLQICQALSVAHKNGIVHRDLSPRNIMFVNENGRDLLKVLDFGLASVLPEFDLPLQRITQTGEVVGTVVYMSPEVARGLRADVRSDIYSLGCILYECISGRPACDGDNILEVMSKQQVDLPESILTAANSLETPKEVELVIFKALQKEPDDRFQSAEEFSAALSLLAEGRASEIHLPGVQIGSGHSTRGVTRGKIFLPALLGTVFLLMVGLAVAWFSYSQSLQKHRTLDQASQPPAPQDPVEQERLAFREKLVAYPSARFDDYVWERVDTAEKLLEGPQAAQAVPILNGLSAELEAHLGPKPVPTRVHAMLTARTKLASFMLRTGNFPQAKQIATNILAYMDTHDVESAPTIGICRFESLYTMAFVTEQRGTPDQSLSWGLRAWDYIQKAPAEVREEKYAAATWWLGEHYLKMGDYAKSITFLKRAINAASVLDNDSSDPWFRNHAQMLLADAYLQMSATAGTPAKRNQLASMATKQVNTLAGSTSAFDFKRLSGLEYPLTIDALKLNEILLAAGESDRAVEVLNSVLQFEERTKLLGNHESVARALNKGRLMTPKGI